MARSLRRTWISSAVVVAIMLGGAAASAQIVATGGYTITAVEGAAFTNQVVATFTDSSGAGPVTDYSASINWGDGSLSAGSITFGVIGAGVFAVYGSHTYAEEGSYSISVQITRITGTSATVTDTANVADPTVVGTGGFTITAVEGAAFTNQVVATFTDPGGAEVVTDYSASINWGDGAPVSAGTITFSANVFTVLGSHTYGEEGSYTVTVTINHEATPPSTVTDTATVSDPAVVGTGVGTITAIEGAAFMNRTVATFTDPGGAEAVGDYSATINWGDGTPVSAGTITFSANVFTVLGSHTYGEEGSYTVTVTINHDTAPSSTVTDTATVSDPAVVGAGVAPITAVEGAAFTNQVVATFTDPGGAEVVTDYSASINWGDGTPVGAGTITFSANVFTVLGSHTYGEEGSYTVTVTINHEATPPSTVTDTATVSDPAVVGTGVGTITAIEGAAFMNRTVATFTDPGGAEAVGDYSATINWGDGTPVSAGTITFSANVFTVLGSHTYGEEGSYTVTVTINHDTAPSSTVTDTATVSDPAVVGAGVAPITAVEGAAFTNQVVATFTDPGGAEPNPFDPTGGIASHYTANINWGDGTPVSAGTITFSGTPGSSTDPFTVSGGHTYGEEGSYTVTVTINHEGVITVVTDTASVSDPAVVGTGGFTIIAVAGMASGTHVVATFTDPGGAEPNASDPTDGIPSHYTASIDWGDATPASAGTIAFSGTPGSSTDPFSVSGSHTYANGGDFTITTTINHEGVITVVTSSAEVNPVIPVLSHAGLLALAVGLAALGLAALRKAFTARR